MSGTVSAGAPAGSSIKLMRGTAGIERSALTGSTLVAAALAWTVLAGGTGVTGFLASLASLAGPRSAGPMGLGTVLLHTAMWWTMMVAMMLPATLPWLAAFGALSKKSDRASLEVRPVVLFAAAYFSVWLAFSLGAALLQVGLAAGGLMDAGMSVRPVLGGVLLIGAGLYQATPIKEACLKVCRNPLGFLLAHWRDGPRGAVRMGLSHGVYCLGCCWALMTLGFVLGVMNLAWMALLTVVVSIETLAPKGVLVGRVLGVGLVVWGIGLMVFS